MTNAAFTVAENTAVNSTIGTVLTGLVTDPEVTSSCDPASVVRTTDNNRLCTAVDQATDGATWRATCLRDGACSLTADETSCTCRAQGLLFFLERTSPLASELADQQSDLIDYPLAISENGHVKIISQLDFETLVTYTLTVKVDDTGTATTYPGLDVGSWEPASTYTNSLSTVATITVTVTNSIEAPYFNFKKMTIEVAENTPIGTVIDSKIYVTDPDKSEWFDNKVRFQFIELFKG